MQKRKITDLERQLLQHIADHCNEASDEIPERDNLLSVILSECDKVADMINDYLETA